MLSAIIKLSLVNESSKTLFLTPWNKCQFQLVKQKSYRVSLSATTLPLRQQKIIFVALRLTRGLQGDVIRPWRGACCADHYYTMQKLVSSYQYRKSLFFIYKTDSWIDVWHTFWTILYAASSNNRRATEKAVVFEIV